MLVVMLGVLRQSILKVSKHFFFLIWVRCIFPKEVCTLYVMLREYNYTNETIFIKGNSGFISFLHIHITIDNLFVYTSPCIIF